MADDVLEDAGPAPDAGKAKREPPTIDLEATEVSETGSEPRLGEAEATEAKSAETKSAATKPRRRAAARGRAEARAREGPALEVRPGSSRRFPARWPPRS